MPELDLEAIKRRAEAAALPPWVTDRAVQFDAPHEKHSLTYATLRDNFSWEQWEANGAFIAHAREDVPALVAEVERLRKTIQQQQSTIDELLVRSGIV